MNRPHARPTLATFTLRSAIGLAATEVARLDNDVQLLAPGLATMAERATARARDSAELRALVVELLPKDYYVRHCVQRLHRQLSSYTNSDRARDAIAESISELDVLLDHVLRFASSPNVLDLAEIPTSVASAVQTHARSAIATLGRVKDALGTSDHDPARARDARTSASTDRILQAVVRLVPQQHRNRYREEFASELHDVVEASNGSRLRRVLHLLQIIVHLGPLRRELRRIDSGERATEEGRRRVRRRTDPGSVHTDRTSVRGAVRREFAKWRLNRMNDVRRRRVVLRERRLDTQRQQLVKHHGWQGSMRTRERALRRLDRNNNWSDDHRMY